MVVCLPKRAGIADRMSLAAARTAGWRPWRAWRGVLAQIRRLGPALGAALLVNTALIGAMVLIQRNPPALRERVIEATMVTLDRSRPAPRAKPAPARAQPAEARPRQRTAIGAVAAPSPIPLAPASKWTAAPPSPQTLEDRPSLWRSLRARERCGAGEFWKLPTEEQESCRQAWARFKPDPADGPAGFGHHEALKDPHGDWARAVAAAEERRRPMAEAPVHPCRDGPSTNFDRPCH
jgi:hypothetical protein